VIEVDRLSKCTAAARRSTKSPSRFRRGKFSIPRAERRGQDHDHAHSDLLHARDGRDARVAGYDVFEESIEVRRRIGYLPENPPLYPEMTVESYLHFVAKIRELPPARRKATVDEAMQKCAIGDVRQPDHREALQGLQSSVWGWRRRCSKSRSADSRRTDYRAGSEADL